VGKALQTIRTLTSSTLIPSGKGESTYYIESCRLSRVATDARTEMRRMTPRMAHVENDVSYVSRVLHMQRTEQIIAY